MRSPVVFRSPRSAVARRLLYAAALQWVARRIRMFGEEKKGVCSSTPEHLKASKRVVEHSEKRHWCRPRCVLVT